MAAAAAALLAASAAPALADDYPPCKTREQDHCRVVPMHVIRHVVHRRHVAHAMAPMRPAMTPPPMVTHAPPPKKAMVRPPVKKKPMLVIHHTVTHTVAPKPKKH
jgi:hypothetical protein